MLEDKGGQKNVEEKPRFALIKNVRSTNKRSYTNWFLLALFFGYQYAARSCAGTFADEIRATFRIDADQFADFGAWCMIAYSCLQIPFGIALDRLGIRRLVLFSFAVCLAGNYTFTHAQTFETARLGRLLSGIGGVPAYMSAVKWVADNFSVPSAACFIGLTRAVGSALVMIGNPLLKSCCLNGGNSWQKAVDLLNYFGSVIFFLCVVFLLRSRTSDRPTVSLRKPLLQVLTNGKIYLFGFLIIGTNTATVALADLWGPGFLMTKYGLSPREAVIDTQLIYGGMLLGSVVLPMVFVKNIVRGARICCVFLGIFFCIFVYGTASFPTMLLSVFLTLTGVFSAVDMLFFALGARLSTPQTSGLTASLMNSVGMFGEPPLQKHIGMTLHHAWNGTLSENGLHLYRTADYEYALRILPILTCVCLVLTFFMKRSFEKKPS